MPRALDVDLEDGGALCVDADGGDGDNEVADGDEDVRGDGIGGEVGEGGDVDSCWGVSVRL